MPEIYVMRRDPNETDDETLGFEAGDVVINAVTGATWWLETSQSGWVQLPDPS